MPVRALPLMLRLLLAFAGVGVLVFLGRPLLGALLARGARNVVALTSWVPHLAELSFGPDGFRLATQLAAGQLFLDPGPYWFVVAFPVAFAAALPGVWTRVWWARLGLTLATSLGVASLLLAVTADGALVRELDAAGLRVNPRWRDLAVRAAMRRFWELAALAYPFAACAWLAWVGWVRPSRGEPARSFPRWGIPALVAAAVLLGACDLLAGRRLAVEREVLDAQVDRFNPQLGVILLRRAIELEASGSYAAARQHYERAARYPAQEPMARQGLARLRGTRGKRRTGGRGS